MSDSNDQTVVSRNVVMQYLKDYIDTCTDEKLAALGKQVWGGDWKILDKDGEKWYNDFVITPMTFFDEEAL